MARRLLNGRGQGYEETVSCGHRITHILFTVDHPSGLLRFGRRLRIRTGLLLGAGYYSERGYYPGNEYAGDYYSDWRQRDINNDARAIQQGQANIRHDQRELREDLRNGDFDAVAHEQVEIQQRRANVGARQSDLNADLSNGN